MEAKKDNRGILSNFVVSTTYVCTLYVQCTVEKKNLQFVVALVTPKLNWSKKTLPVGPMYSK